LAILALAALAAAALWLAASGQSPLVGALKPPLAAGERPRALRALAYSSFINEWGPGPGLARAYEAATGRQVEFLDGGDAGLLAAKIRGSGADAVIGFDQLSLPLARASSAWRPLRDPAEAAKPAKAREARNERLRQGEFLAIDWSQISFIYRKGEVEPPRSLDDLADARFAGAIALPDPRASSPGLQLLLWVLDAKGVDAGFAFFAGLRQNVMATPPSWAAAYGLFQKGQAKIGLGYATSPLYHSLEEGDARYASAIFADGQPEQVEYAGVPANCGDCQAAEDFALWLQSVPAQKIIMRKNYMLPIVDAAAEGTPFAAAPRAPVLKLKSTEALLARRDELFARWARTGL
jgi:thiamine transport system substrate-binding protein